MKSYSVGREHTCNIILKDPQKIISRTHAIINVADNGKITIIDQSTNGTYVNGMRISSNVPVPVSRKDKVSFAHVANLDWNQVPRGFNFSGILSWAIGLIAGIALVLVLVFFVPWNKIFSKDDTLTSLEPVPTSIGVPVEESLDKAEKGENEQVDENMTEVVDDQGQEQTTQEAEPKDESAQEATMATVPKVKKPTRKKNNTTGSAHSKELSVDGYEIPD